MASRMEKRKWQRSRPSYNGNTVPSQGFPSRFVPGHGGLPLKDAQFFVTGQAQALILQPTAYKQGQAQGTVKQTYTTSGQAQAKIQLFAFGQARAYIRVTIRVTKQALEVFAYDSNPTTRVTTQQLEVFGYDSSPITRITKQALEIFAFPLYVGFGQAQASIVIAISYGTGQAQAWIENTYNQYGQAQAQIKTTYYGLGQSQADIKQTYTDATGQTQAQIVKTINVHGQAQADIEQIYNQHGQAQGQTKQIYYGLGQANTYIISRSYGLGQSQAWIKAVTSSCGQANAYILGALQVVGQAQARIKTTYYAHGQPQAWIENTYRQHGQAQAEILPSITAGYGQAQGYISAESAYPSGQANAWIARRVVYDTFDRTTSFGDPLGTPNEGPDWEETSTTDYDFVADDGIELILAGNDDYDDFFASMPVNIYDVAVQIDAQYVGSVHDWGTLVEIDARYDRDTDFLRGASAYVYYDPDLSTFTLNVSGFDGINFHSNFFDIDTPALADTWYTLKLLAHKRDVRAKFWITGTQEPDWQMTSLGVGVTNTGGKVYIYADIGEGFTPPGIQLYDNFIVSKLTENAEQQLFGNAQAYIDNPTKSQCGQAAAIIATTKPSGQAQARIRLVASNVTNPYQAVIVAEGPAAYYPLNELLPDGEAQSIVHDVIGGYDLVREYGDLGRGPVGNFDGIPGTGTDTAIVNYDTFDNGFNYLYRYGQSIPITSATNWGVEFWINLDRIDNAVGSSPILIVGQTGTGTAGAIYFEINLSVGALQAYATTTSNSSQIAGSYIMGLDSWTHVILTRGTGNLLFYVNGALVSSTVNSFGTPGDTVWISPTAAPSNARWYLDELVLYTHQLTADDALLHFFTGLGAYEAYGQAAAKIKATTTKSGQAQARIHRTQGYGQANANISTTHPNGQANAQILIEGIKWHGQARVVIVARLRNLGQANAYVKSTGRVSSGQARAFIYNIQGFAQARANILNANVLPHGQAQALIRNITQSGQARARIRPAALFGQATADIKRVNRSHGFARAKIGTGKPRFGQALATITPVYHAGYGQAQGWVGYHQNALGNARAFIVKPQPSGQARARVLAFGSQGHGNAQARILATVTRRGSGQAQSMIKQPAFGQAAGLISGARYLVRFNNYDLPGYAQSEAIDSIENIEVYQGTYEDTKLSEYTGLQNKTITMRMKVIGTTYLSVKDQVQLAGTMLRSARGFTKLYIQHYNKYYMAMATRLTVEKSVGESMKYLIYEVEFEALPWLFND